MRLAFIISTTGDTNLAIATINQLKKESNNHVFHLISMTKTASDIVSKLDLDDSMICVDYFGIQDINIYFSTNEIVHAYIGVPSSQNIEPFEIAKKISIPFTIAYEYMFHENEHVLWDYVESLSKKNLSQFAVTTATAKEDILKFSSIANVAIVGHLSIDAALSAQSRLLDTKKIGYTRSKLGISENETFIFASGSSQNKERDRDFLKALVNELNTGNHTGIKICFGVHPGVSDADEYLTTMLSTLEELKPNPEQFKIVLNTPFKNKLKLMYSSEYLHKETMSGADLSEASEGVCQAVPGALLNESAICGKTSYFHARETEVYLPNNWFANSVHTLFTASRGNQHSGVKLELEGTCPQNMARCLTK